MRRRRLLNILADHADALNCEGAEGLVSASCLPGYGAFSEEASLWGLLQLAQAVKRALVPMATDGLFRSGLKARLVDSEMEMTGERPFPHKIWVGAAVAGSVLSLILIVGRLYASLDRSRSAATAV